jgi:hypothetical protein
MVAGEWIRPLSDRPSEEVSEHERRYQDGSDPRVLDIVDVPLKNHHPKSYQVENWLLDPNASWVRAGHATWKDPAHLSDNPALLPVFADAHPRLSTFT